MKLDEWEKAELLSPSLFAALGKGSDDKHVHVWPWRPGVGCLSELNMPRELIDDIEPTTHWCSAGETPKRVHVIRLIERKDFPIDRFMDFIYGRTSQILPTSPTLPELHDPAIQPQPPSPARGTALEPRQAVLFTTDRGVVYYPTQH